MKEISKPALQAWIDEQKDFQLIDVREPYEHEAFNIGGSLMPMSEFMTHISEIRNDNTPVVFYCQKGIRSVIAIQRLESMGFTNLYNLTGGMYAWQSS